ncbi:MAG: dephospho-CoA kinase [Clostridiales bacterium]|nr:dephospho-CoA kinase [Clostridiales bacterium]
MTKSPFTRNTRELNERKGPAKIAGLTGGIASGKTVATNALKAAGFFVVDADEVSRALTAKGTPAEKEIMRLFPLASKGGALDRRLLRELISTDASARHKLNAYTHPLITDEIKNIISSHGTPAVISAPLLFESALSSLCDCIVCVTAPKRIRVKRIVERDNVSVAAAEAIISAQIPDCYRATLSDYCVPSDVDKKTFAAEIVDLFTRIFN